MIITYLLVRKLIIFIILSYQPMKVAYLILLMTLNYFVLGQVQQNTCDQFLAQLIEDFMTQNISPASIPTIIYSGITPNNPGQMKQCKDATYQYYLVYSQNQTLVQQNFTSACVPSICTAEDIKQALLEASINATVYSYPTKQQYNGYSIMGAAVISLWTAVITVWSCFVSVKYSKTESEQKKNDKEHEKEKRLSINDESVAPVTEQQVDNVNKQYKVFIFYEGYQQLFKAPKKKSIFSPIIFFAVFSYLVSIQLSYRLSIAENQYTTAPNVLNSFLGVIGCNTEIALHTIMFVMGLRLAYGAYKLNSFRQIMRFYFDNVLKKWILLVVMTLLIYAVITIFTSQPLNKVWDLNNGQDCPSTLWEIWFLFRFMISDCKRCLPWMSLIASELFFIIIATPILLIFRTFKKLGYGIFSLFILLSMVISYSILDSQNVVYEPSKLMNGQKQFVIDYQASTFVRMGAFFFGLIFGLFIIEGLQKVQNENLAAESELAKRIRRNTSIQLGLQIAGFLIMVLAYLLIIPYLDLDAENKTPYLYLILVPFTFLIGLSLFILSSFWEGEGALTKLINQVLGWKKWVHLDRISLTYYMIGPMVIAYSTYGLQSSIYFDFVTVLTYSIGDLVFGYLMTILIASAFETQLNLISSWAQNKYFGSELNYSVLVIEEQ